MRPELAPGEELAGYRIERAAGAGGMGAVYRARDPGGAACALKVVPLAGDAARERFRAEAGALQGLRDPGVVGLRDHGTLDDVGWLALEWLDGVDLARYLRERGSSPRDALDWGRQLARALAAVHAAGLVHRDLKPSNVLRQPDGRLVLIDFGIVGSAGVQRLGPAGTPGYMAPEQARGASVDPRSDLFALGCVLFEAATGRPAFAGERRVATLARVVLDDVPRARELRTDVPVALDEAIARLLRKRPEERPRSADELLRLLEEQALPDVAPPRIREESNLQAGELQLVSVVVVSEPGGDATLTQAGCDPRIIERIADRARARLEVLADGTRLLCLSGSGEASDCVRRAAECALELHAVQAELVISVATGRADVSRRWPVGEAVDIAVERLEGQSAGAPLLDPLSLGLLRGVAQLDSDLRLVALGGAERQRVVTFGRDSLLEECEQELTRSTRLFLRGPAGIGKSHLARALRDRLRERGWRSCLARGSEFTRAVPFATLQRLMLELLESGPAGAVDRIHERFRAALSSEEAARAHGAALSSVLDGLGDDALPRAAQRDPARFEEALSDAWRAWMELEARAAPRALFLDDAQWCDAASLRLLSDATPDGVLLVWLARPGCVLEGKLPAIDVPPLGAEAALRLVASVVDAPNPELPRLVDQAEGNPLFLEELARASAEGGSLEATTVLAMLQARFGSLPEEDRQILRAASVFGRDFERRALPQLLGTRFGGPEIDRRLGELERRGVIAPSEQGGAGGLEFRHDLWREAAYGSLTGENRQRGHRLAAKFLEETGAAPPGVLAQHFQFGGEERRASHWWVRAAEAAILASDHVGARVHLGSAGAPSPEDAPRAAWVEAELGLWAGQMSAARDAANRARGGLSTGDAASTQLHRRALALAIQASGRLGDGAVLRELEVECRGDPWLACQLAREFVRLGSSHEADSLIEELAQTSGLEREVEGELASLRAARALAAGDFALQLSHWERALSVYEELGMRNPACATRGEIGFCHSLLGDFAAANVHIEAALAEAEQRGWGHVRAWLLCIWGPVLGELGQLERAIEIERAALDAFADADDPRLSGACWAYLGLLHAKAGDTEAARMAAECARLRLEAFPPLFGLALAAEGRAARALSDLPRMRALLAQAGELVDSGTEFEEGRALLQLVRCELADELGSTEEAASLACAAAEELLERARMIKDEAARKRFLGCVPEHRALIERAGQATARPR